MEQQNASLWWIDDPRLCCLQNLITSGRFIELKSAGKRGESGLTIGEYEFQTQYQQNPIAFDVGMIKLDWLQ